MTEQESELSFDRAEYTGETGAAPCGACAQPLLTQYWTLQGRLLCEGCRGKAEQALSAAKSGSFWRTFLLGGLTAFGCGIAYALFVHFTDYQLALITIGIAFVIAGVVRKFSGMGGVRYQLLAVALTYFASAMGYFPAVWSGLTSEDARAEASDDAKHVPEPSGTASAATSEPAPNAAPSTAPAAAEPQEATGEQPNTLLSVVVFLTVMFGFTLAAPLISIGEAPIGFFIILFGLWEAWKLTRVEPVSIEGPFRVSREEPRAA